MTKKKLLLGLVLAVVVASNGCYNYVPKGEEKVAGIKSSSPHSVDYRTYEPEPTEKAETKADKEKPTAKPTRKVEKSKGSSLKTEKKLENEKEKVTPKPSKKSTQSKANTDEKKSVNKDTPKSEESSEKTVNKEPEKKPKKKSEAKKKKQKESNHKSEVPDAGKGDCKAVAQKVLEFINSYRSKPATKLSGLTEYAEYRSRQLVSNFSHSTKDERAAATALKYGEYVDTEKYGMSGDPYYSVDAREAIVKVGYVGSVNEVAEKIAKLVKNSATHWNYVGSSEYSYIAVGVTYESGVWYCDIAMTKENLDNK